MLLFHMFSQALTEQQEHRDRSQAPLADCQKGGLVAAAAICNVINGTDASNSGGIRNNGNAGASSSAVRSSGSNTDEDERGNTTSNGNRGHGKSADAASSGNGRREDKLVDDATSEDAAAQDEAVQDVAEEVDPGLHECRIQQSIARQVVQAQAEALVVAVSKLQVLCGHMPLSHSLLSTVSIGRC